MGRVFQNIPCNSGEETLRQSIAEMLEWAQELHLVSRKWSLAELQLDVEDYQWLRDWARNLSGIEARRWLEIRPWQTFKVGTRECNYSDEQYVREAVQLCHDRPAVLLYHALGRSPLLHRLEAILWQEKRLSLSNLAQEMWGTANEDALRATMHLLQMGAVARLNVNDYPLVPTRIHLLARPTDGLVVCLNKECSGPERLKLSGLGCIAEGLHDHCMYCQSATLSLYRCANCGKWVIAGVQNRSNTAVTATTGLKPVPSLNFVKEVHFVNLEKSPGTTPVLIDVVTGQLGGRIENRCIFYSVEACPSCEEDAETWQPFAQLPFA